MPYRHVTTTAIILFCISAIAFTFIYGPAKRRFVYPEKTLTVHTSREIDDLWHSSGIHGRIAIIFTSHPGHHLSGNVSSEADHLDTALRQGLVRRAYFIIPDRFWPEVVSNDVLRSASIVPAKPTDIGYKLLHEGGRILVMPLSKYIPQQEMEKAVVVIEPAVLTPNENLRINNYFKSGQLTADLLIRIEDATRLQ